MKKILIIFGLLTLWGAKAQAADIYFAQTSAGGNTGANCANARALSTHVIGDDVPGNTSHLCGTITIAAGGTAFTFLASGSVGNPITLKFETGANLTSPAWSGYTGAINTNGQSNVLIDGGTTCGWVNNAQVACNGVIHNTSAGTNFTTPSGPNNTNCSGEAAFCSVGILAVGGTGIEIRNLTIKNLYVRTSSSDPTAVNTGGVAGITGYSSTGIHAHHLILTDMGWCIHDGETGDNPEFDHIYYANMDHGIAGGSFNRAITGYLYHDSFVGSMKNWDSNSNTNVPNHHDGFHIWAAGGTASPQIINASIYNNTFSADPGLFGFGFNAFLYIESSTQNLHVFNNVFIGDPTNVDYGRMLWLFVNACNNNVVPAVCTNSTGAVIVNNTLIYASGTFNLQAFSPNSGSLYENNVFSNANTFVSLTPSTTPTIDHNYYELAIAGPNSSWNWNGVTTNSFSAWQGTGSDTHGFYSASTGFVNSDGTLKVNSPAINLGANLTSLGITALNSDRNGNPRPATGPWTSGAINFGTAPPTPGLSISSPPSFGSVNVGSSSSPITLTVTSNGTATATLGNPIATFSDPEFALTGGTCSINESLPSGSTCTLIIVFTPTSAGVKNATVTVGANATASAGLSGTGSAGTASMSVAPTSWNFGNVTQGTASTVETFLITNTGSTSITMSSPVTTFSGTNAGDFSLSGTPANNCTSGLILAPGGTCQKSIIVTPSIIGAESATATFSATTASTSASLTATGTPVSNPSLLVTPRPLILSSTIQGQTSPTVTGTVTNNGNVSVTLGSTPITISGTLAADFSLSSNACTPALVLIVGGTCTFNVSAVPSGITLEQVNLTATATNTTNTVALQIQGLPIAPIPAPSPALIISTQIDLFPMPKVTITGQNFVVGKTQITIDGTPQATVCSATSCTTQSASWGLLPRFWGNFSRYWCQMTAALACGSIHAIPAATPRKAPDRHQARYIQLFPGESSEIFGGRSSNPPFLGPDEFFIAQMLVKTRLWLPSAHHPRNSEPSQCRIPSRSAQQGRRGLVCIVGPEGLISSGITSLSGEGV